jgi:hypothetical protein
MSEREEIMDLIRNEYDPKPKLDEADYPGFEWDDGAGRIADAILADQTLQLRNNAAERETLVKALTDVRRLLSYAENEGKSAAVKESNCNAAWNSANNALAQVKP